MEIDELIEAYLASRQKQFARLSKNGVARIAYLAGYLAAQQTHALDAATPEQKCTTERLCPVHNVWHASPPRK